MADERDIATAKYCLTYMLDLGKTYEDGVLEAVAECISHMRGQPKTAMVSAVARKFKEYEMSSPGAVNCSSPATRLAVLSACG